MIKSNLKWDKFSGPKKNIGGGGGGGGLRAILKEPNFVQSRFSLTIRLDILCGLSPGR